MTTRNASWKHRKISQGAAMIAAMAASFGAGTMAAGASPAAAAVDTGVYFEPNIGQGRGDVRFVSRGGTQGLVITDRDLWLRREGQPQVGLEFVGAAKLAPEGRGVLPGVSNYRVGADPGRWRSGVPHFARVAIRSLYPGVDFVAYGRGRDLEYDLVVAPGTDPRSIGLRFQRSRGVAVDVNGDLVIRTPLGDVRHAKPLAYQVDAAAPSAKTVVEAHYRVRSDGTVAIAVGSYDRRRALVIDPVLTSTRRFGGAGQEQVTDIAVDGTGNVYAVGQAEGNGFPTLGPAQGTVRGDVDAFVSKFNSTGTLIYSTYYGGNREDIATAVAVDGGGRAYVVGTTRSTNLAVTRGPTWPGGQLNSFLLVLSSAGNSVAYSSYLGGVSATDVTEAFDVAVASDGSMWLTGETTAPYFWFTPQAPPGFQPDHAGGINDAFVMRVDPNAGAVTGFTYFGGPAADYGRRLVRRGTDFLVGGDTFSDTLPLTRTFGTVPNHSDVFVITVKSSFAYGGGIRIAGGNDGNELLHGLAVDGSGNIYVSGDAANSVLPVTGAVSQTSPATGDPNAHYDKTRTEVFVAKLDPNANFLYYLTYLGGTNAEANSDLAVTSSGVAYVVGTTYSGDFPTLGSPIQATAPALRNGFLTKLNATGARVYSTYLGGSMADDVVAVALSGTTVWLGATSESSTFPGASTGLGDWDGLIVKIAD